MSAPRITVSRCKGKKLVAHQAIPATETEMVQAKGEGGGGNIRIRRDISSPNIEFLVLAGLITRMFIALNPVC